MIVMSQYYLLKAMPPNGPAPDKSGCGADNFQIVENETSSFAKPN
jgi:hypothetical protein